VNYIDRTHYVIIFTAKYNIYFHSISATEQLSPSSEGNTLIPRVFLELQNTLPWSQEHVTYLCPEPNNSLQ
jgi:hypothetical protein